MYRLWITILLVGLLTDGSYVLANQDGEKEPTTRLKVGVIVPLTGPLAFFGIDYTRTYQLAVKDSPEIEKSISVVFEDSAYDSKKSVLAFNKLLSHDQVDIVLSFGGPMLSTLAPLAEARQIPFFATESSKNDCVGRKFCSLFRNEEDEWGRATWKLLRKLNKKRIGIVKNQNQFMNTFVSAIQRTRGSDETVDVLVDVSPDTVDLRSSVAKLHRSTVDALGVYLLPGSHYGFLNALRGTHKRFFLFGVEQFLMKENRQGFEDLLVGSHVIAPAYTPDYRNRFEQEFGYSAGFFYTPAFYDFIILLHEIVTLKPHLRKIELVNAMRFSGSKQGVSGRYSVKVSDRGVYSYSFPIAVYKVADGGEISVEEIIEF